LSIILYNLVHHVLQRCPSCFKIHNLSPDDISTLEIPIYGEGGYKTEVLFENGEKLEAFGYCESGYIITVKIFKDQISADINY